MSVSNLYNKLKIDKMKLSPIKSKDHFVGCPIYNYYKKCYIKISIILWKMVQKTDTYKTITKLIVK